MAPHISVSTSFMSIMPNSYLYTPYPYCMSHLHRFPFLIRPSPGYFSTSRLRIGHTPPHTLAPHISISTSFMSNHAKFLFLYNMSHLPFLIRPSHVYFSPSVVIPLHTFQIFSASYITIICTTEYDILYVSSTNYFPSSSLMS
ncbi:hypothetical protein O3M35_003926 [Rhynocoris fuscipes]|uniref:Uncharacterized protein n=1 Tax=Rhynocoris fuscipes TaxID=488301 RepID=A0AAW1CHU2_9HEMI